MFYMTTYVGLKVEPEAARKLRILSAVLTGRRAEKVTLSSALEYACQLAMAESATLPVATPVELFEVPTPVAAPAYFDLPDHLDAPGTLTDTNIDEVEDFDF